MLRKITERELLQQENLLLRAEIANMRPNWIGQSLVMEQVTEEAKSVADTEASVFLVGSSGTGKSLLARWIHNASPRNGGEFVVVNCGAIPENLMESELFGHEKGSFTGAVKSKRGRFEQANNGTLFLDEVTEMSPFLQVKLLRVLQEGEFERVGGTKTLRTNMRIIAASNRNLEQAITDGVLGRFVLSSECRSVDNARSLYPKWRYPFTCSTFSKRVRDKMGGLESLSRCCFTGFTAMGLTRECSRTLRTPLKEPVVLSNDQIDIRPPKTPI